MAEDLDLSRCRIRPYDHQVVGVQRLISSPYLLLADEMGAGKTKQTIDAAQVLFTRGVIDRVLVICPAAVRWVWYDPELGELKKHLWADVPCSVTEFHAKSRSWGSGMSDGKLASRMMMWQITNYDFIRQEARRKHLMNFCDARTLLVLDESSAVKSHRAIQTKSAMAIRKRCGRVILLNGTPIANSPLDLYSQGLLMDPRILNCASYFHFRSRYAIMGGWQQKQVTGWQNLEDLQTRLAPYVLRRLKIDCLDLPKKLPSVTWTVPFEPETWHIYKEMRDELVAWLDKSTVATAPQAVVKAIRLAQITSGFLGGLQDQEYLGLEDEEDRESSDPTRPTWLPPPGPVAPPPTVIKGHEMPANIKEVGSEKHNLFMQRFEEELLAEDVNLKLLVFSRFRYEINRLFDSLTKKYPQIPIGMLWGGQKPEERNATLRLLDPRTMPAGPAVVLGTTSTGSVGLNLSGAHTVIYISNDYSLFKRLQSEDRVHRPGQTFPVSYFDIVVTGPQGQKTIDHAIVKALHEKHEIATWTTAAWRAALTEE